MKFALIYICFFGAANVMAQNDKREIEFGMELTSELQATNKGDFNNANLLRLDASLPISRNICIEAASISTYMTASESIGDDLQTFSNLDAGNIPFAISVCNVAWQINDRHSLFMGIRNMNEDYFTSPVTSFFTNSSCGIYPTISANYPIANYPVASVGIHYCYDGSPIKVQASLYNGTGYNRFTGRENVFRVCPKTDGIFGIAEVSYTRGGSCYLLGNVLHYNSNMSTTPWLYTEQSISQRFTLLVCYSQAFSADAECKDFIGLGALCLMRKWQLGAFADYAEFVERNEFATELTVKIPILQHMDIQPTAHIITYDKRLLCVAMLRMSISF